MNYLSVQTIAIRIGLVGLLVLAYRWYDWMGVLGALGVVVMWMLINILQYG